MTEDQKVDAKPSQPERTSAGLDPHRVYPCPTCGGPMRIVEGDGPGVPIHGLPGHRLQHVSRGLGDDIARLTKAAGVQPCGECRERQAALNKAVPSPWRLPAWIAIGILAVWTFSQVALAVALWLSLLVGLLK